MTSLPAIASHIPGRLRLRDPALRGPTRNQAACDAVRLWPEVLAVEGNPRTGSILMRYDAAAVAPAAMVARARDLFAPESATETGEEPAAAGLSLWDLNRYAKLGMIGSLAGSLVALAVGKKAHAALGAMHVAFLLVHMANHRKRLLD